MKKSLATAAILLGLTPALAFAHHGWGSYDVARKLTIESPIESVVWQNPHVHVMLKFEGTNWEVTLAPISRMTRRGVEEAMLKPGVTIAAEGYPSTRAEHEMRAERITIDGKVYEMR
ncbi:MAG: hypothetical protein JNM20_18570 [Rhizobiales bacterium]|nr:hypothetical protein [Hyphomicrobiales bacterium]